MDRRLMVLVTFGLLLAGCSGGNTTAERVTTTAASPGPPTSRTPISSSSSPSPLSSPSPSRAVVFPGVFPERSYSGGIGFRVGAVGHVRGCALHLFPARGIGVPTGAFYSDCPGPMPLLVFDLGIDNRTEDPLPMSLTQLSVVDRSGGSHQPLELKSGATPKGFLANSASIAPQATLTGLVAFDASGDYTPGRFLFAMDEVVLTVRFEGQETVKP